jgi:hypothetical protein
VFIFSVRYIPKSNNKTISNCSLFSKLSKKTFLTKITKKMKAQKAQQQEAEEEEKNKRRAEKQRGYQRVHRQKKKIEKEKLAAKENSVVDDGAFIAPPRNGGVTSGVPTRAGSSPFHSIGNNEVSYESLNILASRLADSAKAKRSNIALLKEAVEKANKKEDENNDKFFQLITGKMVGSAFQV